jgi:hypothetical protein
MEVECDDAMAVLRHGGLRQSARIARMKRTDGRGVRTSRCRATSAPSNGTGPCKRNGAGGNTVCTPAGPRRSSAGIIAFKVAVGELDAAELAIVVVVALDNHRDPIDCCRPCEEWNSPAAAVGSGQPIRRFQGS